VIEWVVNGRHTDTHTHTHTHTHKYLYTHTHTTIPLVRVMLQLGHESAHVTLDVHIGLGVAERPITPHLVLVVPVDVVEVLCGVVWCSVVWCGVVKCGGMNIYACHTMH
jgi:hypothetical protein